MSTFEARDHGFWLDGNRITIISGAIHYFRVVPEYWEDRLLKLKACGFNTVETYIAWNVHEPTKGEFHFDGLADVEAFIRLADTLGLHVIVRPSPYICAEWEFGGLPAWLLADSNMKLRCFHEPFQEAVSAYYDELMPRLRPLLCTNGGPIIAMQVENEYGSYGNDKRYLTFVRDALVTRGIDVLLFTSDGPDDDMLQGGSVNGVLQTVNFGSGPLDAFAKLARYQPDGPKMCMEFWNGWFDHWGDTHHRRPASEVADVFHQMLEMDASVNFYMFHGGTNFGFYNGANRIEKYEPTITSYDYDVLLDETGNPTDKFYAVREVISKYVALPDLKLPKPIPKAAYGEVQLLESASLFDALPSLSDPLARTYPETMEKLGQNYGFILYTTWVTGPRANCELHIQEVRDRALVFLDNQFIDVVYRADSNYSVKLSIPNGGAELRILVENMGRVNYGPFLRDCKGVTEGIRLGNQFLFNWTIHRLPLDDLSGVRFRETNGPLEGPRLYRGSVSVDHVADTFLDFSHWTKGVAFVNGFNLGRYWNIGPQRTLYVPGPLLVQGKNEIVLFELHHCDCPVVNLVDQHQLGE